MTHAVDKATAYATENDANLNRLGRNSYNGGATDAEDGKDPAATADADAATPLVGSYEPNSWGLYDMHGGVYEFCLDPYSGTNDYGAAPTAGTGTDRVKKGGCFSRGAYRARAAFQVSTTSAAVNKTTGFRVAITLP